MAPFRNPFNRRPAPLSGLGPVSDENARPSGDLDAGKAEDGEPERPGYTGSRASSGISITKPRKEPDEFKMSVVNDSGVYLPPSPSAEHSGFLWRRTPTSTTTSSHRSMLSDSTDGFSISRESFDSYRRSFDISARSPVSHADSAYGRQSLDSYPSLTTSTPRTPRSAFSAAAPPAFATGKFDSAPPPPRILDEEERDDVFDDVGLDDAGLAPQSTSAANVLPAGAAAAAGLPPAKKRGLFARLGDAATGSFGGNNAGGAGEVAGAAEERPGSGHRGFHLPGRKRGQSGQGAELRAMPRAPEPQGEAVAAR